MVARVLIVDEQRLDVSKISMELQLVHNSLLFSKSIEDALRIVSTQSIDIVLISLPTKKSKLFLDFFSVLRQLCSVIPIIGIVAKNSIAEQFVDIGIDDFVDIGVSKSVLLRKIETLVRIRQRFDDNLLNNMFFTGKRAQKMVSIFFDDLNFLHSSIKNRTEIEQLKYWPVIDDMSDADLFLINIKSIQKACDCCATLRLRKINKNRPIVLTYDKAHREMAKQIIRQHSNIGYTDVIDISISPAIMACKLNSLMKYKKMYESFTEKLKKSIYLAAIDATTEVYNRTFFEDFMKNRGNELYDSAILVIDVDKFKRVNDKFGHTFADSMLRFVASTIKRYIRSADLIARYGGDEFIIFMEGVSKSIANEIAARVQKAVEKMIFKDVNCTVSIGVCCVDEKETLQLQEAISIADKFMYTAKKNGGNSVCSC
ncbi:MAG: diguanylate cyclase [Alphaproteobacteria bacterium]|nr:diguanylate cyclase [Alphaproteobacteria bacterium]